MREGFLFPQECPSGALNEDAFQRIYSQFFPQGGVASIQHPSGGRKVQISHQRWVLSFRFKYVRTLPFQAFDTNDSGSVSFQVSIHLLFCCPTL